MIVCSLLLLCCYRVIVVNMQTLIRMVAGKLTTSAQPKIMKGRQPNTDGEVATLMQAIDCMQQNMMQNMMQNGQI